MLLNIVVGEILRYLIGTFVIILGIPIGKVLSKSTQEELQMGRPWFKLILYSSLSIGVLGLFLKNDFLLFGFFFIAMVTLQSIIDGSNQ